MEVDGLLVLLGPLNILFDIEEHLNVKHVLVLGNDFSPGVRHQVLKSLDFSTNVLFHGITSHLAVVCLETFGHLGFVRRSSEWHHSSFIVLEVNMDDDFTLVLSAVLANVLSVVEIVDVYLDLRFLLLAFFIIEVLVGDDFEFVSSRSSVLSEIVPGLDGEFDWSSWRDLLRHATRSVGKRLGSSGVQEVAEVYPGGGNFLGSNLDLHDSFLWSENFEVWSHAFDLCRGNESSWHLESLLGDGVDRPVADSEKHVDVDFLETLTCDSEFDSTGELTEGWLRGHDGVGWTDNLSYFQAVEVVNPTVVPSTEYQESLLSLVVGHGSVLSWRWKALLNIWVGCVGDPLHHAKVDVAAGVHVLTEGSSGTFVVLGAFTTKDEEFPGWNGLKQK